MRRERKKFVRRAGRYSRERDVCARGGTRHQTWPYRLPRTIAEAFFPGEPLGVFQRQDISDTRTVHHRRKGTKKGETILVRHPQRNVSGAIPFVLLSSFFSRKGRYSYNIAATLLTSFFSRKGGYNIAATSVRPLFQQRAHTRWTQLKVHNICSSRLKLLVDLSTVFSPAHRLL